MISGYVSVKVILDKLYRDLEVNTELNFESCVEWVGEALSFIGAFNQFTNNSKNLDIKNFKAELPPDFYKLADISYNNGPIYYSGNSLVSNYFCNDSNIPQINTKTSSTNNETFYINDYYIYTSVEEGTVNITYLSFPVDGEGFPMVPDDIYYIKACTAYVTRMLDYQEWRRGKIADKVFEHSDREWNWYVGAAQGSANMPNASQLENLKNIFVRLIPQQSQYSTLFTNLNSQERKKIQ